MYVLEGNYNFSLVSFSVHHICVDIVSVIINGGLWACMGGLMGKKSIELGKSFTIYMMILLSPFVTSMKS